jgi:gliding motility-associated-like protein
LTVTVSDGFTTSLPTPVTVNISDVMEGLIFYSAFSPNGDGVNDTFEIDGLEAYPNCHVKIFNSDGIELFSNVGYTAKWDGSYKGKEMPLGTYFYLINLNDGSKKTFNGHFMIIK